MNNDIVNRQLLIPISADQPCGPNLEYDPDFVQLESAIEGRAEQQYGNAIIPAEEPDWLQVERQAEQLLLRSKDLRTAHCYLRARTRTRGLLGLAAGLDLFASLLETYWSELHPAMQVDGELDPLARFYAISNLANPFGFVKDVKDCELLRYQNTILTVRDIEQAGANGRTAAGYSREQVATIVRQAAHSNPEFLSRLQHCKNSADQIEALAVDGFGAAEAPSLSGLKQVLKSVLQFCTQFGADRSADEAPANEGADTGGIKPQPAISSPTLVEIGELRSRRDVEQALQLACQYFQQHEPTNPAPFLLKRALRLMSMNFMDIVNDMAPDGLRQIQAITGSTALENS